MNKRGLVLSSEEGMAKVMVTRSGACGPSCASCSSCSNKDLVLSLPNYVGAEKGDFVELTSDNSSVLSHTALVYIVPLLMFIVSVGLSYSFLSSKNISNFELLSFLIGIIGLLLSYFVLSKYDKKLSNNENQLVKISRVVKE